MVLMCRGSSIMVFHGLLTKRRPLGARYETKDFNGKSGRPWILVKEPLDFTLRDVFHPYFSSFLDPLKLFEKVLGYGFAGRNSSRMVFHGLLTRRRPLEARYETKDFKWGVRKTMDFSKRKCKFHFPRFFYIYFSRFLKPVKLFAKMLRYGFAVQKFRFDGLSWPSNKRKTVRSKLWKQRL